MANTNPWAYASAATAEKVFEDHLHKDDPLTFRYRVPSIIEAMDLYRFRDDLLAEWVGGIPCPDARVVYLNANFAMSLAQVMLIDRDVADIAFWLGVAVCRPNVWLDLFEFVAGLFDQVANPKPAAAE